MAQNKKQKGIVVFVIIVLVAATLAMRLAIDTMRGGSGFGDLFNTQDYVAELYIEGVIEEANDTYNQRWLLDTIESLENDSKNKGIMLFIDSPGGSVYESDETYLALRDYAERTGRPVYAYLGALAASGGYYIACAAEKIYANRNTLTGSIGVISASSIDATGLLEKLGIKSETITAGKNKNMLNYNSPLSDEQREIMQAIADEAYDQFTGIVAESRGMEIDEVRILADGRVYTAQQAEKNGLIDGMSSYNDALVNLLDEIEEDCTTTIYRYYEKSSGIIDWLLKFSRIAKKSAFPDALRDYLMLDIPYPAYIYRE